MVDTFFDKVFIINLDHRTDRWQQIQQSLDKAGITNYERFSAVKPEDVPAEPHWAATYHHLRKHGYGGQITTHEYALGALGCKMSHYAVLQLAKERQYQQVLILEDDADFLVSSSQLNEVLHSVQEDLAKSWHMLYFMGNHKANMEMVGKYLVRCHATLTTGAYAVHARIIDRLLQEIRSDPQEIDVVYCFFHMKPECHAYCVWPHVCRQRPGYSDVIQKDVDYAMHGT